MENLHPEKLLALETRGASVVGRKGGSNLAVYVHSCLAARGGANTQEALPKLVACGLQMQGAAIYPCQQQALLTIFNESPLLLLLPSAMTFTI